MSHANILIIMAQTNNLQQHHKIDQIPWQSLPLGDVFVCLNSKRDGLTHKEAEQRLRHFGLNTSTKPVIATVWKIVGRYFLNILPLILVTVIGLTFFLKYYAGSLTILFVLIFNLVSHYLRIKNIQKYSVYIEY